MKVREKHFIDRPAWQVRMANILDRGAHDIFDLVRWITIVGVTRYLWADTGKPVFAILYWILAATLFGYLSSQFLLRTNVVIFPEPQKWWQTSANVAINSLVCVVAFGFTLWFVEMLTEAYAERHD